MTTTLIFGLITVLLLGLSVYLTSKRTMVAKDRGELFLKRKKQRFLALMLLFPAALSLMVALVNLYNMESLPGSIPIAADVSGPAAADSSSNAPAASPADAAPAGPVTQLNGLPPIDAELKTLNAALTANPNDAVAYGNRGILYMLKKSYNEAESDFRSALRLNPKMSKIAFNLAEIQLEQKKFDEARTGFADLQDDSDVGEISTYESFLCDLFGEHETIAGKELDAYNQTGSGAGYYFANIAWLLYHHKPDDAQEMLDSANRIYPPDKIGLYSATLTQFGYLPIPLKPNN